MASYRQDSIDLLAAEYVLGTLDRDRLRAVELRLETDAAFAGTVGRWSNRMLTLTGQLPAKAPGEAVWARIEERLDGRQEDTGRAGRVRRSLGVTAAVRRRRRMWAGAFGLGLAAAACALILAARVDPTPSDGVAMATLYSEDQTTSWEVRLEGPEGPLRVQPGGRRVTGAAQSLELWLVAGDDRVTSLGLLPAGGVSILAVSRQDAELILAGSTLAISLEPLGGSPTGLPTGSVVAANQLIQE